MKKLKQIKEEHRQSLEDEAFFEMTNVVQERTGLPFNVWISTNKSSQGPSIKVQGDYSKKLRRYPVFTVTISDEPKITGDTGVLSAKNVSLAKEFVKLNKVVLLDYWNEVDIDVVSILSKLKKLER